MIDQNFYKILLRDIPEERVESVHIFHHTVIIKTSSGVGVSSIAGSGMCPPPKNFTKLQDKTLCELSRYYLSDNYLEVAIGMAAINAHYNREDKLKATNIDFNAHKLITEDGIGKNIAIIGGFPFIERLKDKIDVKNWWVFELNPRHDYELSVDRYAEFLPKADITIITATTLVNKTFHKVYPHLSNGINILTGPTTPMNDVLFNYKISALAGMIVDNYKQAFLSFSQGAASKDAMGVKKICKFLR